MSQLVKDSFLDLERHRQILEDNITKLRKSLKHWQTWEAEYEGLKEEIATVPANSSEARLLLIVEEYDGELVNRAEVRDILGIKSGGKARDASQITGLLSRRIEYVQENSRTIAKQLETAEGRLEKASIISTPDVRNEDGLPMTEIIEELDDDGNVISGRTSTPGCAKPQLLEVLQKAGVSGLSTSEDVVASENVVRNIEASEMSNVVLEQGVKEKVGKKAVTIVEDLGILKGTTQKMADHAIPKKEVRFVEETKAPAVDTQTLANERVEALRKLVDEQNTPPSEPAVIPDSEDEEYAALRKEMLNYGMSEVGSVVAELDLEEGSDFDDSDFDEVDDDDDDDDDDDSNATDDEDKFGRSTGPAVDDKLRKQMFELEAKLGVRMMENVGPKAESEPESLQSNDKTIYPPTASLQSDAHKKSVRFADSLDISSPSALFPPSTNARPAKTKTDSNVSTESPLSDIVERRAPASTPTLPASTTTKKPSRFKQSKSSLPVAASSPNISTSKPSSSSSSSSSTPQIVRHGTTSLPLFPVKSTSPAPFSAPLEDDERLVPSIGPQGRIVSSSVVERTSGAPTADGGGREPRAPEEMDQALLRQEVAVEYHRMRNRMIQRQGGFAGDNAAAEEEERATGRVPLTEEEGGPRRVSRFKAARLRG